MYLEHFGIREAPFSLTPDTSYFFASPSHQAALNTLLVALRMGEGFIKVVGEVGTGKTLLCRKLLKILGEKYITAYIADPYLTPVQLRMTLANELGVEMAPGAGQRQINQVIHERLLELSETGKRVVLILDEAQALPNESLEALRLLTNLETEKRKLLQIAIFGQPELDQRLAEPGMRQLRQRITFSHRLEIIDYDCLGDYVYHRLCQAGYQGRQPFTPKALKLLYRASHGVPRLINVLSHKSLMAAFGRGTWKITPEFVQSAAFDTEGATSSRMPLSSSAMKGVAGAVFLLLVSGLYYWMRGAG